MPDHSTGLPADIRALPLPGPITRVAPPEGWPFPKLDCFSEAQVRALLQAAAELAERQQPVAWMTHHDEPMLFPTREEAASYCDFDEEPIPLGIIGDLPAPDARREG